jgi:cytochrome c peroxidase
MMAPFASLPETASSPDNPVTEQKFNLGRLLFFETRLSRNRDISCNSCHDLSAFGVDHKRVSVGDQGQLGTRNAPTVYNSALQFAQMWDGRAATVEEQAKMPVLNPVEMAMESPQQVESALLAIPGYVEAFRLAFPNEAHPVTFKNMANAIGAFERVLITPSRWDEFLRGDAAALTHEERFGSMMFHHAGCMQCHNGALVGGTALERLGKVKPWPNANDPGRFSVTMEESDRMVFKVPSLRNVVETAPYFHDGSASTLEEAISRMAEYQVGIQLSRQQVEGIAIWLGSLTGRIPQHLAVPPQLPPDFP